MTNKILKGWLAKKIEARMGKPLEEVIQKYDEHKSPLPHVAKELGCHLQTLFQWRRKLNYPKRRVVNG